jgi:DNA (cytosine-5)-methyltransferase 1
MHSKPAFSIGTVIDLFAGVGGLSLGASRAGFKVALAVEKDARIAAGHKLNFPNSRHAEADVAKLTGRALMDLAGVAAGQVDGLIGGPPCQGFSPIGKKDINDKRNELFVKFFSLVREVQPRFFLAENVPGILGKPHDELRKSTSGFLNKYEVLPPIKVTASDFGAPTSRTRVFFIGYLKDEFPLMTAADFQPDPKTEKITAGTALKGLPTKIKNSWLIDALGWRTVRVKTGTPFWERVFSHVPAGVGHDYSLSMLRQEERVSGCIATLHADDLSQRYGALGQGECDKLTKSTRLDANGFCPTLRAGTGSDRGSFQAVRPIHPTEPRVITPREAARLQGFPDWFRFDQTKWHSFRQIGNSVSPIVAETVLSVIANRLVAAAGTRNRQVA